ncbi:MAG: hypothetical protein KBS81_11835 [Spirochaetales bacterium]|nr:hypothetical protein [Candidatus Physcosoma equi]
METEEAMAFLKEREEKLGAPIVYKAYATWFAEVGRERREFGVFLYSDGKTIMVEDFFRPATVLGYELTSKREKAREKEYVKTEIAIPVSSIKSIHYVSRHSAEASLRAMEDKAKDASLFSLLFQKNATCIRTEDRIFFLELPSHKEFVKQFSNTTK